MVGHLSNNIIEERTSIPSVLLRREQLTSPSISSPSPPISSATKTIIATKTPTATATAKEATGAAERSVLKFQLHLLPRDDLEEPTSFLSFCPYTNIIAEGSTEDEATNAWIEKASEAFSCAIILGHSSFTTKKVICGVVPSSSVPVYVIVDDQRKKHVLGPLEMARLGLSGSDDEQDEDDSESDGEDEADGVLDRHDESGMRSKSKSGSGSGGVPKREDSLRSSMDEVGMLVDWRVSCTTVIAYPLSLRPYYSPSSSSSSCSSSSSSSSSGSAPALNALGIPRFGLTPHYIN